MSYPQAIPGNGSFRYSPFRVRPSQGQQQLAQCHSPLGSFRALRSRIRGLPQLRQLRLIFCSEGCCLRGHAGLHLGELSGCCLLRLFCRSSTRLGLSSRALHLLPAAARRTDAQMNHTAGWYPVKPLLHAAFQQRTGLRGSRRGTAQADQVCLLHRGHCPCACGSAGPASMQYLLPLPQAGSGTSLQKMHSLDDIPCRLELGLLSLEQSMRPSLVITKLALQPPAVLLHAPPGDCVSVER